MATTKSSAHTQFRYFLVGDHPGKGGTATSKVVEQIRKGYQWNRVHQFQETFMIKDKAFAKIIGISDRSLTRTRKKKAPLDPIASDRMYRVVKVLNLAVEVFEGFPAAVHWLQREQPGLEGRIPIALLDTEPGTHAVETLLTQLEYGVLP